MLTCPAKLRCSCSFFQKWLWWQLFSHKPWTHDGEVRSWPWAQKIWHVQTSFGTSAFVFENGCEDKCFRTGLGHTTGKWCPREGLRNASMSCQAQVLVFVFFRNGCGGKSVRTNLGHTTGRWSPDNGLRKSDMSKQALEPVFFLKTGVGANVFGQVLGTRPESEVPAMG